MQSSNSQPSRRQPRKRNAPRKQNPPRKRQRRAAPSTKGRHSVQVTIAKPAQDWAASLVNPFTGPLTGIPDYPAIQTRKYRTLAKGTMSTGTAGFGYIAMTPDYFAINNGTAVSFTDSTYAGTTILLAGAGNNNVLANSDYALAAFGAGAGLAQYRVVSAGLRVRYNGTAFDMGGSTVGFVDPRHQSVLGKSYTDISGEVQAKTFPVVRKENHWVHMVFRHLDSDDLNYKTAFPAFTPAATDQSSYMVFACSQPGATVQTFDWEAYATIEATGRAVRGQTPSHYDPVGFAAVHAAMNFGDLLLPWQGDSSQREKEVIAAAAKYASKHTSSTTHVLSDAADVARGVGDTVSGAANIVSTIAGFLSFLF